ncbi:MAG: NDP-sugar synthase, partial [Thermoproteus sp.]
SEEILPRVFVQGTSPESLRFKRELKERIKSGDLKVEGNVLIGRHVKIGRGVHLKNAVVDNYTIIEDGAEVVDSVIMDRSIVEAGAKVERSIVGRHGAIGRGAVVMGSVLGDDVSVGSRAVLINVKVWPHKAVSDGVKLENFVLS